MNALIVLIMSAFFDHANLVVEGVIKCDSIKSISMDNDNWTVVPGNSGCVFPDEPVNPEPPTEPPTETDCVPTNNTKCFWLPGFERPGQSPTRNATNYDLRGTHVFMFDPGDGQCKAGSIEIKEAGDNTPKSFAITLESGKTTTDRRWCQMSVNPSVTGKLTFNPNNIANVCHVPLNSGIWKFSISCGRCKYFFRADVFGC